MRPLSLSRLYYLCDPAVPVVGGPLMRGYETMLAGSVHQGKHIIAEYLASQYKIRHEERCTADFVPAACRRLNVPLPASREETPDEPWFEPTYWHDVRFTPWPVHGKRYDLVVALRVWHHLVPLQKESFEEARRIAKRVLIVCPEREIVGRGITRRQ